MDLLSFHIDPVFHMWFVLLLTGWAIYSFSSEKIPLEATCVSILTTLLIFGQFFPVQDAGGNNQLDPKSLLEGFANPSLVAVLCLLVMGQAIIQTDALRPVSRLFFTKDRRKAWFSIIAILVFVMVSSAFMNNTPLVIIAIPIIQYLATELGMSESRMMIPLSYVAILGGMTTLVGSSTNLLVSSAMTEIGYAPLGFFDFAVPGMILAGVGLVYILLVLPRLLPDRSSMARQLVGGQKEFVAELDITHDSKLIGKECVDGAFPELPDLNVRLIQRAGHLILPPFEGYSIQSGDILIVAATRDSLTRLLSKFPGFLLSEEQVQMIDRQNKRVEAGNAREGQKAAETGKNISPETDAGDSGGGAGAVPAGKPEIFISAEDPDADVTDKDKDKDKKGEEDEATRDELERQVAETRILAEIMISPGSRMVDMAVEHIGFERQYGVIILGVQRRARVVRRRLGRIRLEPGDVLLVAGSRGAIDSLQNSQDLIVLSGSKRDLPTPKKAPIAVGIFLLVIALAAIGVISIPVAAIAGAVGMIASGCLNIRQATRAVDRKIFLLVGSMLALGTALQVSGGAHFIAELILDIPFADIPLVLAGILFFTVALATNILTNNACAILFTPIALNMAVNAGIDPFIFAVTVVFGANCSFASPIGYQTNLLVMGPGHYRFRDFMKAGIPLMIILWVAYIFLAKFYYGL